MTTNNKRWIGAISLIATMTMSANVCATNGMFTIAPGTKSRGMGGVSIPMTHSTLTSAVNPATMALSGNRFDIGADVMITNGEATLGQAPDTLTQESTPGHFTIADGVYMLPNIGASWQNDDLSYGFTMVGVGGGGSHYDLNFFNNELGGNINEDLGVSLLIMNINPTIAYKINKQHSVGASLIIGMQIFKAYGLNQFTIFTPSQDPTAKFTDQGTDLTYGAGIRVGWLGSFMNDDLTLGAEFTSQTYMKEFDDYVDLFAEQGKFNTPGNIGIGAAYKLNKAWTIAMDINYVMYEDVPAVSNKGPIPRGNGGEPFPNGDAETYGLGRDQGLAFGWSNQTIFKIGTAYGLNDKWTLRAGWNYAESPIDEETEILFNIMAPATTQNHLTLGGTYIMNKDTELSFSYIHAYQFIQSGPTYIGYEGEISMSQDTFGATFSYKF